MTSREQASYVLDNSSMSPSTPIPPPPITTTPTNTSTTISTTTTNEEPSLSSRHVLILYATQTGTTEDLAAQLSDLLLRLRFSETVHSFSSFLASSPTALSTLSTSHRFILLLVSTTGQGALPDSALPLWRQLCRKRLPGTFLQNVEFGVFALGDRTYPKFCWAGKMVGRRFLQLGAREVVPRVEGDMNSEEGGEGGFVRWCREVGRVVREKWPLPEGVQEVGEEEMLPARWRVEVGEGRAEKVEVQRMGVVMSSLKDNKRITPKDYWQDVRLLTFSLHSPISWAPGDTVSLAPQNHPDDIAAFLFLQDWTSIADSPLTISPLTPTACLPPSLPPTSPITLRTLLTSHLSLTSIPTRRFFLLASHLTSDTNHASRLLELSDPHYIDDLYDYTTRPRRTLLEVLQEFNSIRIPLCRLLDLVPPLRSRHFSIASAPCPTSCELQLLVAVVHYKTVIKAPRRGVCTRWLAEMSPATRVPLVFGIGGLADSVAANKPVLMIAAGTGVAPMRALIQSRSRSPHPTDILIFGARNISCDYFFSTEWPTTPNLCVFTAFSRDQKHKRYVQTVVREQGRSVWGKVGGEGATVFVCGSSGRMPTGVREALVGVFEKEGEMERGAAVEYLERLEKNGRYRQETW